VLAHRRDTRNFGLRRLLLPALAFEQMRQRGTGRAVLTLLVALAFGLVDAALKGHHGGLRDAVGNVSAPWLMLPLVAGAFITRGRPLVGALAGIASVLTALIAFYLVGQHILSLGVGGHSTRRALSLGAAVTNRWFESGMIAGLGFGAVGAWLAGRDLLGMVAAALAALLVFEPAAHVAYMAALGVEGAGSAIVSGPSRSSPVSHYRRQF
jgi:hypothetical protein